MNCLLQSSSPVCGAPPRQHARRATAASCTLTPQRLLQSGGQRLGLRHRRRVEVRAEESGTSSTEQKPLASSEDNEDEPIWVKREKARELADKTGGDLPFGVYLLFSVIVAIAAVGSIFEITNKNAIFGVVGPDSPLWLPILGVFAVTGLPTSGYLFYKAVSAANKMSEEMDRMDGYK